VSEPRLEDLDHVGVDVEPLGDPRWSRIERGMFAKLDRPVEPVARGLVSGGRLWVGGAGLLAAAAAVTLLLGRPSTGLRSRDPLRLVTTSSPSRFTIGESSLWIEPSSLVLVSGDDEHGVDVVLDHGMVTCEVAPRRGRPPFVVDAGEVRVQVVGTRFTVTRAGETSVDVDHGVVEVAMGGVVTVLHDGERWPAAAGSMARPAPGSPGDAPSPREPSPSPVVSPFAPEGAAAVPSPGAARGSPVAPGEAPAPATDAPALHAAPSRKAAMPGTSSGGGGTSSAPSATPAPSSAGTGASAPTSRSPQQVFESAARIERTRPDDAAALYRELASGGTAWAGSALFALGRLEADRGHRGEATRLLDEYLARYPRGINVDDARALLQHLQ
jgi:hypothetical protein